MQKPDPGMIPLAQAGFTKAPILPNSSGDRQLKAIIVMCIVSFIFALQDGLSRHLGTEYSAMFVVMVRYWFMALFVLAIALRKPGGIRAAARSKRPFLQILRGVLLIVETVLVVQSFILVGLIDSHAIFACTPLIVVALSGPILGEKIGWRRWIAVAVGFLGILIVLNPSGGVFSTKSLLPFAAAVLFAAYGLLTRLVSRDDPASVSFFWTGIAGAVTASIIGLAWLQPVQWADVPLLLALCAFGVLSHFLLIRAYEMAEASSLQPFAYTQLVWVALIGMLVFHETLTANVAIGGAIVVGAGLFTWWRTVQANRQQRQHLR